MKTKFVFVLYLILSCICITAYAIDPSGAHPISESESSGSDIPGPLAIIGLFFISVICLLCFYYDKKEKSGDGNGMGCLGIMGIGMVIFALTKSCS